MTDTCLDIEAIAEVLQLPASDPRRRHVERCARCSALALAYEAFVRAEPVAGADPADARRRLAAAVPGEKGPRVMSRRDAAPGRRRGARWILRPVWGVATVVGLLVVVAVIRLHPWLPAPTVLRGGSNERIHVEAPVTGEDGAIELRWSAVEGADAYRVTLLAADLSEISTTAATPDTHLTLPPGSSAKGEKLRAYWQVTAFAGGDPVATSAPVPFGSR